MTTRHHHYIIKRGESMGGGYLLSAKLGRYTQDPQLAQLFYTWDEADMERQRSRRETIVDAPCGDRQLAQVNSRMAHTFGAMLGHSSNWRQEMGQYRVRIDTGDEDEFGCPVYRDVTVDADGVIAAAKQVGATLPIYELVHSAVLVTT